MIFRRKRPSGEGGSEPPREETTPVDDDPDLPPLRSFTPRAPIGEGFGRPLGPMAGKAPVSAGSARPAGGSSELPPRRAGDMSNAPRKGERPAMASSPSSEGKKLIVGRDIILNGQISACERLVVEGRVEAELTDCRTIEIAETGTFKGSAAVESAEISGRFEGALTVHERLLIRSSGRVTGTVRYGRIEIEQGGEINGDVKSLGTSADKPARPEPVAAASPASEPRISVPSGSQA